MDTFLSAFAEDHGRKPMVESDGGTLRSSKSEGGCFGGYRRRKDGYHGCKPVEASSANFKEPVARSSGANGTLVLMKSAPHPNAAKMFVNWFLSREGQTTYQKTMNTRDDHIESLRDDIPKDLIPPDYLRNEGGKYVIMNTAERMNSTPVLNLFKATLQR